MIEVPPAINKKCTDFMAAMMTYRVDPIDPASQQMVEIRCLAPRQSKNTAAQPRFSAVSEREAIG